MVGGTAINKQAALFVFDDLTKAAHIRRNNGYPAPHGFEWQDG
jgi:F0F1-type ATP synthase alpha subunit